MALASIQIVLTALALSAPTTAPGSANAAREAELASLYDQATCATIYGEADDWARAAIGEDEVPSAPAPELSAEIEVARPAPSAACNDRSLGAKWREMLIACSALHRPERAPCGLRVGRAPAAPRPGERRMPSFEVAFDAAPSPVPAPHERDTPRARLAVVDTLLVPPPLVGVLVGARPTALRSIAGDELLRPPRV